MVGPIGVTAVALLPLAVTSSRVRHLIAGVFSRKAAHLLLIGLEERLNCLSPVCDEFIDVDIATLVSIDLLELLSQLVLEFGGAPVLRDLRVGFFEGNAMVAIMVNGSQPEFLENSFLVLFGKFTLGDFDSEALLSEQLGLALNLSLCGLSPCELSHVSLAKNLERHGLSGGNEGCESNEDRSHI